ncbi:MAG TPA: PQQ-dependent sugar dehydrogenase [Caldilineaceae bacterium]|nr:PQQ-dependent sugar dehydrogenase [Caldilineaceae bacterium]
MQRLQWQSKGTWLVAALLLTLTGATVLQPITPVAAGESMAGAIQLKLEPFASGFTHPVKLANAGDNRLFVVEQSGVIYMLDQNGNRLPDPFIDLTNRVLSGGEQGLLGLAFEPDNPSIFYVDYTRKSNVSGQAGDTVIARYQVMPGDPNRGNPASEEIVLVVDQPYPNHNGGDLAFGPDGYLYIPLGDGGSGGDPENRAQNLNQLLGKVLRIDVVGQQTYAIPPGNPYANDNNANTRAEIWSLGWRNPFRFSFDRATGDMYYGDVGQGNREEVDYEPANTPGRNYGWNLCEGSQVYPEQNPAELCPTNRGLTMPIFDYGRGEGTTVTGGFVYRGSQFPGLVGHYIFADFGSGAFWTLLRNQQGDWDATKYTGLPAHNPSTFGENSAGELFVADYPSGAIYRIIDASDQTTATPTATLVRITPEAMTPQSYLPLIGKSE